jgi:hypothetical protein
MQHIWFELYPEACIFLIRRSAYFYMDVIKVLHSRKQLLKLRCVYLLNFILVFELNCG